MDQGCFSLNYFHHENRFLANDQQLLFFLRVLSLDQLFFDCRESHSTYIKMFLIIMKENGKWRKTQLRIKHTDKLERRFSVPFYACTSYKLCLRYRHKLNTKRWLFRCLSRPLVTWLDKKSCMKVSRDIIFFKYFVLISTVVV